MNPHLQLLVGGVLDAAWLGIIFCRMSRATKRACCFVFSTNAVVSTRNGVPHLVFRVTNLRKHQLVDCSIRVYAAIWEETQEGESLYKFHQLKLDPGAGEAEGYYVRYLVNLPWSVAHPIDETSPLYGLSPGQFREQEVEIIVILEGTARNPTPKPTYFTTHGVT